MLRPPLTPLKRRPNVPNLPDPHRAPSRAAGSFSAQKLPLRVDLTRSPRGSCMTLFAHSRQRPATRRGSRVCRFDFSQRLRWILSPLSSCLSPWRQVQRAFRSMIGSWTIGAQLSTSHLSLAALDEQRMLDGVRDVLEAIELDLLIIGFREAPEVFRRFCAADRPVENVYLWFSALSDTAGMTEEDLIVDWRGARSRGWGGWAGKGGDVEETFRFACPNNPVVRERTTLHLRELLHRYDFKGQCQSNRVRRCCRSVAISRAAIYAARARHSAKAAERLCL
jgi:hypothetical protein